MEGEGGDLGEAEAAHAALSREAVHTTPVGAEHAPGKLVRPVRFRHAEFPSPV
jgi:hypothetical protein